MRPSLQKLCPILSVISLSFGFSFFLASISIWPKGCKLSANQAMNLSIARIPYRQHYYFIHISRLAAFVSCNQPKRALPVCLRSRLTDWQRGLQIGNAAEEAPISWWTCSFKGLIKYAHGIYWYFVWLCTLLIIRRIIKRRHVKKYDTRQRVKFQPI